MPITEGSGNPKWTRDETILALDLFYREGALGKQRAEVVELSTLLRSAQLFPKEKAKSNARNPDGVALKLQNLWSAIDPKRGLSCSKLDKEIVLAFPKERQGELAELATALRRVLTMPGGDGAADVTDDDPEFIEGGLLFVRHRRRDQCLRKKLLRLRSGNLTCEICGFSPPNVQKDLQESFFEAHHKIPLAVAEGERSTKVSETALLCAGCHRFLHRIIVREKRWASVEDAREHLAAAVMP